MLKAAIALIHPTRLCKYIKQDAAVCRHVCCSLAGQTSQHNICFTADHATSFCSSKELKLHNTHRPQVTYRQKRIKMVLCTSIICITLTLSPMKDKERMQQPLIMHPSVLNLKRHKEGVISCIRILAQHGGIHL